MNARARQRGLALVVVLWAAIMLALIAGGVIRLSRGDLNLARNMVESTRAELAADSAVRTAVYIIVNGGSTAWRVDGTVYAWRIGDAEVRVRVTDEFGRIDVNVARPELLAALFIAAGVEPDRAHSLADAVAEYRRQAIEARVDSGKTNPAAARGAPFAVAEGLRQVPDIPAELVERIAPAITVYTGEGWPREQSAPPLVLAATEERVLEDDPEDHALVPAADDTKELGDSPAAMSETESEEAADSALMRIEAEAATAGGSFFAREAVIGLGSRSNLPYEVRLWRRGSRVLFPVAARE